MALLLPAAPASADPPEGGAVTLNFENVRNARGMLRVCLTTNPRAFPDCSRDSHARTLSVPATATSARFEGLAAGTYAVSLIHDENGNGRMDMALVMPREGFGFSRNPRIGMGPPRFDAAAFAVGTAPVSQTVRVRYML
jgi:uncharacterized protein (DUF2141 family)